MLNVNQGVLRTSLLQELGGFSEEFRDYGIDPDLTAKVLMAGFDVVYTKSVGIHHHRQWSTDKTSPTYQSLLERQHASQALYKAKYENVFGPGRLYTARRAAWALARRALGRRFDLNGKQPCFGLLPRDWHNVMGNRFVSPLDPLHARGKPYHLRQTPPRWLKSRAASRRATGTADLAAAERSASLGHAGHD